MRIVILGGGRAGKTLGRLLHSAGHEIAIVFCRSGERAREAVRFIGSGSVGRLQDVAGSGAQLVLICVPDGEIAGIAQGLKLPTGAVAAHVSGVHSAAVLAPLSPRGAIHPLMSFADPERAATGFPGTFCSIDGEPGAVELLQSLARQIGGVPWPISSESKALYHAGAVFASNYVVAAFEGALRLFEAAGIPREPAQRALRGLTSATAGNIAAVGLPQALTGPIERGDIETVRMHVRAIAAGAPDLSGVYAALAWLACEVALAKGTLTEEGARRIREVVNVRKG